MMLAPALNRKTSDAGTRTHSSLSKTTDLPDDRAPQPMLIWSDEFYSRCPSETHIILQRNKSMTKGSKPISPCIVYYLTLA
jgi:hypothetical protein